MIKITLKQLSYFVATAEHGSTLRAAEMLAISQPAISMAIKQLEATFGQPLFVRRHAQGVSLTPFGRRKVAEARHLLSAANAFSEAESGRLTGHIEVGAFATLAPVYVPGLLRAFRDAHPDVVVHVREASLDQLHRDLDAGTIELALMYDLDLAAEIDRLLLAEVSPYALLPARHPLARKAKVSIAELAREPFVLIDLPGSREAFLSIFRSFDQAPQRIVRCSSLEMVRGMVANGHGLAILVTRPYGDRGYDGKRLACRPLAERVPPHRIVMASAAGSPMTGLAAAFAEVSRRYFAAHHAGD
jgi:DNA-binding transcriptional LysR family regulator